MRNQLIKYVKHNPTIRIMYISDDGTVTQRLVRVIKINSSVFTAYCHLRKARRTFKFDNVLAIVPIYERAVV